MGKFSFFKIFALRITKKWKVGLFVITIWIQIAFPCFVEAFPLSFGQNTRKYINSTFMFIESFAQHFVSCSINRTLRLDIGNEKDEFRIKGGAENITRSIKSSSTINMQRNPGSGDKSNHGGDNSDDWEFFHIYLFCVSLFLMFSGIITSMWVINFTQRGKMSRTPLGAGDAIYCSSRDNGGGAAKRCRRRREHSVDCLIPVLYNCLILTLQIPRSVKQDKSAGLSLRQSNK